MKSSTKYIIVLFLIFSSYNYGFSQNDHRLWYNKPAKIWTDALPIGNGRLGAMIYGGIAQEQIQFNEETLWTGKPRNYNRKGASQHLAEIRRLLAEGKQKEAETLAEAEFMGLKSEAGDRQKWVLEMKAGKGITGNPATIDYDDKLWKTIQVPSYEGWELVGLANVDGAVWFRTTFEAPANWNGKDLVLDLNRIRDQDFTYINGTLVGNTDNLDARKYTIPAKLIKTGTNTIAIQVLNYFDKGGIAGFKDTKRHIGIYPVGSNVENGVSLVKRWRYLIQNTQPPEVAQYQASYQPFGDVIFKFAHESTYTNYKRSLDLNTAIVNTSYTVGQVNYNREYFASEPNQAIVMKMTADRPNSVSLDVTLSSVHQHAETKMLNDSTLGLFVRVKDGALNGEARLTALVKNGSLKVVDQHLVIAKADEVIFYLTAGTNFVSDTNVNGRAANANDIAWLNLEGKKYDLIKKHHLGEYGQYFTSFNVNFGTSANAKLPTDQRIEKFATEKDPALIALYMQYGRYLLISSSRKGTQPANLQGIWNDMLTPPWGSKYTTNINFEMNYWPADVLGLAILNEPFFSKAKALSVKGEETAKEYYNAKGWVLHHNTDLWNGTAPINASNHGIWVAGGAWLTQHFWEHYLFSKNEKFLRNEAYPIMKKSAEFFVEFLVRDPKTGWLISTPSNSPENGGLVAGPTMDHQIIRSLFNNCIEASQILGVDESFRKSLQEKVKLIAPNQIGKYQQLQEWLEDKDDTTNKHRHVSHLWGVYPGSDITWSKDAKMMEAAKQSLLYRGDDATGWSLAWKINFWARFKDGEHAMKLVKMLLKPATNGSAGSYVNLFDAHPPFQIDGNFGAAAGIAEMLIQSHQDYIELLPALPSELPFGKVNGIRARGGFMLNFNWNEGKLNEIEILPKVGGVCWLRYGENEIKLNTEVGKIYRLNGKLEIISTKSIYQ
ncbi:glycoside hydrolase family 95 protein [Pedobacter cryotolerans]|uniref:Glycoside hydrolase family 95 protein n=1 Tax=Pedobacter cryotolerans TaxID=2571270 RepID=A0A4U1CBC4_9SPHI|nr:glycoside hydrolase N-terminal domain-containing protein [Pedobacter cryotolerans]TKC02400.1 glycoside hydrolase family 95 protein [Pedobacter cryotolerans]